ncbi:MAG TPA: Calx-beta domain-containing protein [Chloroflexota bacterium]|nr:Calx-beta domain-containing protein [Chloroflexota bacterium]
MTRKLPLLGTAVMMAVCTTHVLLNTLQTAVAAPTDTLVLYDGALGGTPDTQNMAYGAIDLVFPFQVEATQTYSAALLATILDTTPDIDDMAGYGVDPTTMPTLTRQNGFQFHFTMRVVEESHASPHRAGFNVTVISGDLLGIELAFWENEIWAQEGGDPPALFTHAEGMAYDTTTDFVAYELEIIEDIYRLSADGVPILTGPLRDYTAWEPPLPQFPDPYEQPNLVALSDNTSSAQALIWLRYVGVTPDTAPLVDIAPTSLTVSETVGTAVLNVQLNYTSTFTVTVAYETVAGTAVPGTDYTPISGTLTLPPGVLGQSLAIPILDNTLDEPDREFTLVIADPSFARLGQSSATITIQDDDEIIIDPLMEVYLPLVVKP